MFVAFNKDVPGTDIKPKDVREVPDVIGRAYVESGYGQETDAMTVLRASQTAMFADLETKLTKAVSDAAKTRPEPPGYRVDSNFEARSTTPAERAADKVGLGEIVRCLYWKRAFGDDERISESQHRYAVEKLDKVWKLAPSKWMDKSDDRVNRDNPTGIARDGSESTQGAPTYGYLVRPEFAPDVYRIEPEKDVMIGLKEIPVGSAVEYRYPALDQYSTTTPTRTSNYFAGVALYRKPEDAARTTADMKISEIIFKLTDLTGMTKLSRDLLADSFIPIDGYVTDVFRQAFRWRRDWDFLQGTGSGEPIGIFNSAVQLTQSRGTSAHIEYEDLVGALAQLHPSCWSSAYWIANVSTLADLMAIKNHAGNYVYQPNAMVGQWMTPSLLSGGAGGTANAFQGSLMGLPVKFTEKVPALGTANDLTIFHGQSYGEATKMGLEVGLSEHRYFETDQVAIRFKLRNDGQPMWKGPFYGADGKTYSCIVSIK